MNEVRYMGQGKISQEDLIFECLKNITICLYNERSEQIRKLIVNNNSESNNFFIIEFLKEKTIMKSKIL